MAVFRACFSGLGVRVRFLLRDRGDGLMLGLSRWRILLKEKSRLGLCCAGVGAGTGDVVGDGRAWSAQVMDLGVSLRVWPVAGRISGPW